MLLTVVGACNFDLIFRLDRMPALGESLPGLDFETAAGGKGLNQAIAASRLGVATTLVGQVGSDMFGDALLETLARDGVDRTFVHRSSEHGTGVAAPMVDREGNNAIVYVSRANAQLNANNVHAAENAIARSDILLLQQEIPEEANLAAAELARKHGTAVILNAAPARAIPDQLMSLINVLILNEVEVAQLSGLPAGTEEEIVAAGQFLQTRGPRIVVVTIGPDGALLLDGDRFALVPTHEVDVVDTTGAGDAFCAGFAVALAHGELLLDAVNYGNTCGALACRTVGAAPSMPTHGEVKAWLDDIAEEEDEE